MVVELQQRGAGTSYSITEQQYDSVGRAYKSSNPHNSTVQYWTTTEFDALGRVAKTILPDSKQTSFTFASFRSFQFYRLE